MLCLSYLQMFSHWLIFFFFCILSVHCIVLTEVHLITSSGRQDYVVPGESFKLSCMYLLEKREHLKMIQWDLDGNVVYVHKEGLEKPLASGVLANHVNYSTRSLHSIDVTNATKEMAGTFKCHVYTNLNELPATNSRKLIIIVDSCNESNWRTHSDMVNCREQVNLACTGVYPRPTPSCAIYNEYTGSVYQSELVERIEQTSQWTYDFSLFRNYLAKNLRPLNAPLSFRCSFKVEGTSWRRTFVHHLFAESGCLLAQPNQTLKRFVPLPEGEERIGDLSPLLVSKYVLQTNQLRLLFGESACLAGVREGAIGELHCGQTNQMDSPLVLCMNRTWLYVKEEFRKGILAKLRTGVKINWDIQQHLAIGDQVRCDSCIAKSFKFSVILLIVFLFNFVS